MADIELVIKIPEEIYKRILPYRDFPLISNLTTDSLKLTHAVANGVPLPKGHGRIGDLNKLESEMYHEAFETDTELQKWDSGCWIRYKMFENAIANAQTIIEADKVKE